MAAQHECNARRVDCAFRYRNDSGRSKGALFSTGSGTADYLIDDVNIEIVEAESSEGAVSKDYTFDKLTLAAADDEETGATAAIGEDGNYQ